jgi:hypothetical protein
VIAALSRLEMRLLVVSAPVRISDPRCRKILAVAYEHSCDKQLELLLWESFLLGPAESELRRLARDIAHRGRPLLWRELATADVPSERAADAFLRQAAAFEEWFASKDVQLAPCERFARPVQRMLLERPLLATTDRRVSAATIHHWALTAIPADARVGWQKRYVEATCGNPRAHDHTVLTWIVDEHGAPEGRRRFWEDVAPAAIADVERWLKDRQLTELLGEGDRVRFWRRFLTQMTGSSASADGHVVFVQFESWFAAQFVDAGVATYMFPSQLLWSLRRDREFLRIRSRVWAWQHRALGRYEQRGDSWQFAAEREVRRVIRELESA